LDAQSFDLQTLLPELLKVSPFIGYLAYQVWSANSERIKQREEDQRRYDALVQDGQKRYDTLVQQVREGLIQSNVSIARLSDILEAGRGPPGPRT
jgi:hypothetical protein